MTIICGQSNRYWHYAAGRWPGKVALLAGPAYFTKLPYDSWMPFALDNDAFMTWKNGTEWNESAWFKMLKHFKKWMLTPLWCLVPDVVADREKTLEKWIKYAPEVEKYGWQKAFAVQDGMTVEDVPSNADLVFVGGTTEWKWRTLPMWCEHFERIHVGRVNSGTDLERCEAHGVESCDGTGWFRGDKKQLDGLKNFLEGHRDQNLELQLNPTTPTE